MRLRTLHKPPVRTTPTESPPVLLAVTPPRTGERTLLGVENLLASIAVPEPFSLELAGDADGVTLMARCQDGQVIRGQISAHYPQARIHEVAPEQDPLRLEDGEQAWSMTLRSAGPEYVPLRTFRDDDLTDPGSDPLLALLGALSDLHQGERIVARLLMRSLGPGWAAHHQRLVNERPVTGSMQPPPGSQAGAPQAAGGLGNGRPRRRRVHRAHRVSVGPGGRDLEGCAAGTRRRRPGLIVAGWVKARFFKRPRVYSPLLIQEKVSRIAFDGEIQVTAILPSGDRQKRAEEVLSRVAAAYRHYDNPAGASFTVGEALPAPVLNTGPEPAIPGLFGKRSVIGVREAAALWHPPSPGDETPLVGRSGSRALIPSGLGRRRSPGGRHHDRQGKGDTLPRRSAPPPPPLRGPHPHGQVDPHAPSRCPQDAREGRRPRP